MIIGSSGRIDAVEWRFMGPGMSTLGSPGSALHVASAPCPHPHPNPSSMGCIGLSTPLCFHPVGEVCHMRVAMGVIIISVLVFSAFCTCLHVTLLLLFTQTCWQKAPEASPLVPNKHCF